MPACSSARSPSSSPRRPSGLRGAAPVVIGLVSGSLVFFVGDWLIDRGGGHRRKSPTGGPQQGAGAMAMVLGALLDGIAESAAIGVSVLGGGEVGIAMVAAVFLSNVPESMSASAGLKRAGRSTGQILRPDARLRARVPAERAGLTRPGGQRAAYATRGADVTGPYAGRSRGRGRALTTLTR